MHIIGIVAVDKNGAIGKDGRLPWRYAADLRFFKQQTFGHACVMGRRTWLSLARPLPGRLNIILSRTSGIEPQEGVIVFPDKASVLALRPFLACDLFIIGGSQVYRSFQAEIERWIVTEVPLAIEDADTFMPDDYLNGFTQTQSQDLEDDLRVTFYDRA